MPKVSVILPNFNHAPYLEQRLESIFSQTFQDYELILLDDLSTDNSVEILSRYARDPRVSHFVVNDANSGSSFRQWGKGLSLATGKYVWIAESDDFADPSLLEHLVSAMEQQDDITLAYCRINRVRGDGSFEEICQWGEAIDPSRWDHDFVCSGTEAIQKYLQYRNTIVNASAVLFRRERAIPFMDEIGSYRYCGDWLFWILMLTHGNMAYVSRPLSYFRRYESATSLRNVRSTITHRFVEYQRVLERVAGLLPPGCSSQLEQYEWIVREWMSKRKAMSLWQYLVRTPLQGPLKTLFYLTLWHQWRTK